MRNPHLEILGHIIGYQIVLQTVRADLIVTIQCAEKLWENQVRHLIDMITINIS